MPEETKKLSTSVEDFKDEVPLMWAEEILDSDNETVIGASIIEDCGPLSLMLYLRVFQLSQEYFELSELSSVFLSGVKCH